MAPSVSKAFVLSVLASAAAYDKCKVFDCMQNARISWTINYAATRPYIEATMSANGMGYVAVGVSPGTTMSGDIILGWIPSMSQPGQGLVRDYNVGGRSTPRLDAQQDVTFLSSSMRMDGGGQISITWRRALNTSDPNDAIITPGRAQNVMWATNPNSGAVTSADGSSMQRHLSNTRGIVSIDFGAPSSCDNVCGPSGPRRIDVVRSTQCLANGWTPAEAAGDRDGGAARPRMVVQRSRNATRLVPVNVSSTSTPSGSGMPSATQTPTSTTSAGSSGSGTPLATSSSSISPSNAPASSSNSPTSTPSPTRSTAPMAVPDAVASPLYMSADGRSFKAAWASSTARLPNGTSVPGLVFQIALGPGVGYGALGFSTRTNAGMMDADMIIVWARKRLGGASCSGLYECAAFAGDYTSGAMSAPQLDTAIGGANNMALLDASIAADGTTRVTFVRPLLTGDISGSRDVDLTPGRTLHGLMYAVGSAPGDDASGVVAQHTSADLTPEAYDVHSLQGGGPIIAGAGAARARLVALHGCAMMLAYWLAMALGIAIARYRPLSSWLSSQPVSTAKHPVGTPKQICWRTFHAKHRWFVAHTYLQVSALVLIVVGWFAILAVAAPGGRAFNAAGSWGLHEKVGISAFLLALAQGAAGGMRPSPDHPRRRVWLLGHRSMGRITLLLGSAAIFSGLLKAQFGGQAAIGLGAFHVTCYVLWTAACEYALMSSSYSSGSQPAAPSAFMSLFSLIGSRSRVPVVSSPKADGDASSSSGVVVATQGAGLTQVLRAHTSARSVLPMAAQAPSDDGHVAKDDVEAEKQWQHHNDVPTLKPVAALGLTDSASVTAVTPAPTPAASVANGQSSVGHRAVVVGLGTVTTTAVAVIAALASGAAKVGGGGSLAEGHDDDRRRLTALRLGQPVDVVHSRRQLYETIWVNETYIEVYNETVFLDSYPGGERDLCFFMTNTSIPSADTSYLCRGFALPTSVNLHALEFEFLADRSDLAHHMVVFTTWVDPTRAFGLTDLGGGVWDCSSNTPNMMGVGYVWAVGQDKLPMPPRVGLRVGVPPGVPPSSYSSTMSGVPFVYLQMVGRVTSHAAHLCPDPFRFLIEHE